MSDHRHHSRANATPDALKLAGAATLVVTLACVSPRDTNRPTITDRLAQPDAGTIGSDDAASAAGGEAPRPSRNDPPIAVVNGHPITRGRVMELLLAAHGPGILEQLVVHDEAVRLARERGLTVSEADVEREYDRALRRLIDPLASVTAPDFDREEAERVLAAILAERNISRDEYRLGIRRNAYLRAIVQSEMQIGEADLRAEYERRFGERLRIRHIQLATQGAVARVQEELRQGRDFAEVARRHSANAASAAQGGLLDPFSSGDEQLPAALREAAERLSVGEVSAPVRVGEWYHVIRVEERLPAEHPDWNTVRSDLERTVRDRRSDEAMQQLYTHLFEQADIRVLDPTLKRAFQQRHPDRP